jgi:hypothetical protein
MFTSTASSRDIGGLVVDCSPAQTRQHGLVASNAAHKTEYLMDFLITVISLSFWFLVQRITGGQTPAGWMEWKVSAAAWPWEAGQWGVPGVARNRADLAGLAA